MFLRENRTMPDRIVLSVRSLVEYVFLRGSIDAGFQPASSLAEGAKTHQNIQRQYGERDRKEVHLQAEIPCGEFVFVVEGRCDGLLAREDGGVTIDEIKSTARSVDAMTEADAEPVHWAQAQLYAYMYALESGERNLRVRLTYVQAKTEEQIRFERDVAPDELTAFAERVVAGYAPYARLLLRNRRARNASIEGLAFPFPAYRTGQKKLAGAVYKAIGEGRKLFAKAPTGIGKTISTLYPAIKAIGSGMLEHLFYLTARTTTRAAAEDALARMKSQGLHLRSVTITAKEKICFREEVDCRKEACPYADGYYDRVNETVCDLLANETLITRDTIELYARKHTVCPFELSLDTAYGADAVICDYNYLFDPRVSLKRLTAERRSATVLLVDEAHNLIDRAREMYSAALDKRDFLALQRAFKGSGPEVHATSKAINKWFIARRKTMADAVEVGNEPPEELLTLTEAFAEAAERELLSRGSGGAGGSAGRYDSGSSGDFSNPGGPDGLRGPGNFGSPTGPDDPGGTGGWNAVGASPSEGASLLDVYFKALSFNRIGKLYDASHVTYTELAGGDVRTKMFCVNPSQLLHRYGKGFRSHVFFSATLSPLTYYMDMLGAEVEDYSVTLGSPFAKEQWEVAIVPLSTRYADRDATKAALAAVLGRVADRRAGTGNFLFFFPSYAYMNEIYEAFLADRDPGRFRTLLQRPDMTEREREQFLEAFVANPERSVVGFAVLGGVFSEGVDLAGDRLNAVAIVGVGLPQPDPERNLIKSHFDSDGRSGFDYAYVYPGVNKVLQAGGRLIRSESDRGELLLVDDRYLQPRYARLLPEEWRK